MGVGDAAAKWGYGDRPGRAVQVEPVEPMLKASGTRRLKLKHDEPLSIFAFKINLRRSNLGASGAGGTGGSAGSAGRACIVCMFRV